MGYFFLEVLVKVFFMYFLGLEIFIWKVDCLFLIVNYFIFLLVVEVLNGDFYFIFFIEKNKIILGGVLIIELF